MALLISLILGAIFFALLFLLEVGAVWLAFDLLHDAIPAVPHLDFGKAALVAVALSLILGLFRGVRN